MAATVQAFENAAKALNLFGLRETEAEGKTRKSIGTRETIIAARKQELLETYGIEPGEAAPVGILNPEAEERVNLLKGNIKSEEQQVRQELESIRQLSPEETQRLEELQGRPAVENWPGPVPAPSEKVLEERINQIIAAKERRAVAGDATDEEYYKSLEPISGAGAEGREGATGAGGGAGEDLAAAGNELTAHLTNIGSRLDAENSIVTALQKKALAIEQVKFFFPNPGAVNPYG